MADRGKKMVSNTEVGDNVYPTAMRTRDRNALRDPRTHDAS
jgi:hypothetical protein